MTLSNVLKLALIDVAAALFDQFGGCDLSAFGV